MTPYSIAFHVDFKQVSTLLIIEYILEFAFGVDILMNFHFAFYDDQYELVTSKKVSNFNLKQENCEEVSDELVHRGFPVLLSLWAPNGRSL